MSCNRKGSWTSPFVVTFGAIAASVLPRVAFASVGAGVGLPYEDTFNKFVTSLTGPWAWTVAIVCVLVFAYQVIQRGGDLGGSTMAFLGPAFICTLLLGAKKVMTFFGQGAMLSAYSPQLVLELCLVCLALLNVAVALFALFLSRDNWRLRKQLRCRDLSRES